MKLVAEVMLDVVIVVSVFVGSTVFNFHGWCDGRNGAKDSRAVPAQVRPAPVLPTVPGSAVQGKGAVP